MGCDTTNNNIELRIFSSFWYALSVMSQNEIIDGYLNCLFEGFNVDFK